ncbi:MAG: protein kinase [Gammaproteobacteria bacterium]|nr:protein kinase [Gammaproteobacteria bacterium]
MADVDVPGYRLHAEIGRGARSRVYSASHHARGGTFAIKVTKVPIDDPGLDARFLEAGQAARKLEHPNIVRVLDVGKLDGAYYRVMEYVRGGDLDHNLANGLHLQNLLMATKDVAAALDYAHGRGVVHGDLRPGNILFDEQGAVRVSGFAMPASTAAGFSPYCSPEQAGAGPSSPRSDFYSLGVIFYQMLTGRLPDATRSGGAGGTVVRLHEPPLPLQFAAFRPVVDRLLARSPEDRFENGLQLAAALDDLRARDAVPDAVVRTEAVTAQEIDSAESSHVRQQPASPGEARRPLLFRPPVLAAILISIIAVAGGVGYVSDQSGWSRALAFLGLAPHPDAALAWEQAEDLASDRNQSLSAVVSAYRRVLAIDANHVAAAEAIEMAAERWRNEIDGALDAGELGLADRKLDELATVFPGDARSGDVPGADAELARLVRRFEVHSQVQELLAGTSRQLARRGLGDVRAVDAAIASYKGVLRLDPGNERAAQGLTEIAIHYGAAAERLAATDFAAARDSLERAVAADDQFTGIDGVRATLRAAEDVQEKIEDELQLAADLRQDGALITPAEANPLKVYRGVLAIDPDNEVALQAVSEIAATVLAQFDGLLRGGTLEAAREFKDQAAAADIGDDLLAQMDTRYDQELLRIATVLDLIARAEELYRQGYVTGPDPDNNAVALLREALRLDPDSSDGIRLLSVSATRLADVAGEAYTVGLRHEALQYLDLALAVTPGIGRWRAQREQWQAEITPPGPSSE